MSEKDFWTKYCRAEYLNRTKNAIIAAAEAAEDEELAVFLKHDDILANEARRKVPTSKSSFFYVFYCSASVFICLRFYLLEIFCWLILIVTIFSPASNLNKIVTYILMRYNCVQHIDWNQ